MVMLPEFPRAEAFPELLLNGIWSWEVRNHSMILRICSRNGAVKDAWNKIATETASDVQTKQAKDQAKTWISGKLSEQRAAALTTIQTNNKSDLEEAREIRRAFSSLLQFGFWPELISYQMLVFAALSRRLPKH